MPCSAWLFRDEHLLGGGTRAMEGAAPGEWEQQTVISLELSGEAELGGQMEPQGHPHAIRGEVQVDRNRQRGSTPGSPECRSPRGRGGP